MDFHIVPLLKRMVWLKILYIQKSDELLFETVIGGKSIFTKKSFTRENLVKDFFVKINFQPMRALNSFKK